jgi:hypothetical protein|tara:strand:- start:73 stop:675 length:603 start_codon:yes stop_codon:yes gene_type:complete
MLLARNKQGALELSIGTIVVIVIGMSMLILGLVLVKTIFTGSTAAIGQLNDKVQGEISSLFVEEGKDIVVMTSDRSNRVKVKPGDSSDVGIGMLTPDGSAVGSLTRLQYKMTLDTNTQDNCVGTIGVSRAEDLFITNIGIYNNVDAFDGSSAFALVEISVPKGTEKCTQKVHVEVKDTNVGPQNYAADFFVLEILSEGIF